MTRAMTSLSDAEPIESATADHDVTFGEATRVWARVAALSFGGPAGQIATMHRILVEEKRWIGEARFLHALNYCMLLPGPEAQPLAIYIGWLLHRTAGGLIAGTLFVLPGAVAIMALSLVYAAFGNVAVVQALFFAGPCSTDQSPHAAAVNAPAANCAKSWAKAGARRGKGQVRKRENPALWFAAAGLNGSVLDAMLTSIHCLGLGYAAPHASPAIRGSAARAPLSVS